MDLPMQRNKLFSNISLSKVILILIIITTSLIPLLVYKGVNYATELPKVIALTLFTPLLLFLVRCLPQSEQRPIGYLGIFIYAYLGFLLINSLFSLDPVVSFFGYYGNFTGFFFYLFALSFFFLGNHFREQKTTFIFPLVISASIIALISIFQFWNEGQTRAMGPLGHPIGLANFLMLMIPGVTGLLLSPHSQKSSIRISLYISFFLLTTALLLTFSRGGWVGYPVFFILFFFSLNKATILEKRRTFLAILTFIFLSVLAAVFLTHVPRHSSLITNSFQAAAINQSQVPVDPIVADRMSMVAKSRINSYDVSRIYLLEAAWQVFCHHPFGAGLSTFYFTATPYLSKELREKAVYSYAHNDFMHTLATQGVTGGIFYIVLIVLLLKIWWQWRKDSGRDVLAAGLWAGVFTHLVILQSNFPAYGYTYLFWFFIGLLNNHHSGPLKPETRSWLTSLSWKRLLWGLVFLGSLCFSLCSFQADATYLKAYHASKSGKYEQADLLFDKAMRLAPWVDQYIFAKVNNALAFYQKPHITNGTKQEIFQTIKGELLTLNSLNPLDSRYKAVIGDALITLRSYQNAITFYKQASQLYPNNSDFYDRIGYSLIQLSKYQEAQGFFQKSLQMDPQNQYAKDCLRSLRKYQKM